LFFVQRQVAGHNFQWRRNFRIILFLFALLFIEVWKWVYRAYNLPLTQKYNETLVSYMVCSIFARKLRISSLLLLLSVLILLLQLIVLVAHIEEILQQFLWRWFMHHQWS
jgi:hypothetical protein